MANIIAIVMMKTPLPSVRAHTRPPMQQSEKRHCRKIPTLNPVVIHNLHRSSMISTPVYRTACGLLGVETDLKPDERVIHLRESGIEGTVRVVEGNLLSVMIEWDDCPGVLDFQWANKVERVEPRV
jgi:hypothetical protein